MGKHRVFVSHSSKDKSFATSVVEALKSPEMKTWIDHEQIFSGDDIFDRIGEGLTSMDIMIFLASNHSLASEWVKLEVKYAALREIEEKRMLVLPFRLHDVKMNELPWFLRTRNAPRVTADSAGTSLIVDRVRTALEERFKSSGLHLPDEIRLNKNPRIERLLASVSLGDWEASREAAVRILELTNKCDNGFFNSLLSHLESPSENQRWAAIQVLECYAELVPELYDSELLNLLGNHKDFSIRSMVSVICYGFAHFAPHLVPLNLMIRLSRHDEDWYVNTPAIGALKTLVRWRPTILKIFFMRLKSGNPFARELAAGAIFDISRKEPEVINPQELEMGINYLKKIEDRTCLDFLVSAQSNIKIQDFGKHHRYGAF